MNQSDIFLKYSIPKFLFICIFLQKDNIMDVNEHDTLQSNTSKNSRVDPDRTVPYLISV